MAGTNPKHELEKMGFRPTDADPGLFSRVGVDDVYLDVHVDDMFVAACKVSIRKQVKSDLVSIFDLHDIDPVTYHLGMEIQSDCGDHSAGFIKKYVNEVVSQKRFHLAHLQSFLVLKAQRCLLSLMLFLSAALCTWLPAQDLILP